MDTAPEPSPVTSPAPAPVSARKGTPYGAIIGVVIIVLVLVAGAFYVWNERLGEKSPGEDVVLPDGSMPTVEGSANVRSGENGPQPI